MPVELQTRTRVESETHESLSRGFALAAIGHVVVLAAIAATTWLSHRLNPQWGQSDPTAGSIQASMVNSLPLPNTQRFKENEVLTSDKPSIAPTPPPPTPAPPSKAAPVKARSEPPPRPEEVLIPKKAEPPRPQARTAEREQPVAPRRVVPPPPPSPKATTGETAGVQIPQSITQLKNGTASITVQDRAFGERYAYYIGVVARMINQSKAEDVDPPDTRGKRTAVHFVIQRDGSPKDVQVETRSGSSSLDLDTMRAIQRIDSFGPLPSGNELAITYIYDSH